MHNHLINKEFQKTASYGANAHNTYQKGAQSVDLHTDGSFTHSKTRYNDNIGDDVTSKVKGKGLADLQTRIK